MAAPAATGSSNTSLPPPTSEAPQEQPVQSVTAPSSQQQAPARPQFTQLPPAQTSSSQSLPSVQPPPAASPSTPTSPQKIGLTNWWKGFRSKGPFKKGEEQEPPAPKGIFGVSLNTSIQYAYVNISITNAAGNSEVYGRIPIVVAKCGSFLKEKATDVEGIFRVSGSAKRIKELQSYFDSPPMYGKTLEWDGFNVHDAANVFRRYINHLPEPIIPYDYYFAFRKPLEKEDVDIDETIKEYQRLIGELPRLNGQLLLYILDLLAVFAETSSLNLMPAANLAAIFQPGLLSHTDHDMTPQEYRISQEVLVFLIQHQDRFLPTTAQRPPGASQSQQPSQSQASQKQPSAPSQPKPTSKAASQPPGPPAKYSGVYPPKETETPIPRRRTLSKKSPSPEPSPAGLGKMLRRHRSSRTPQSPKLGVEQEEPRRVSEGSERASAAPVPIGEDESLITTFSRQREDEQPQATTSEPAAEDVYSSPVTHSDGQIEPVSKDLTDNKAIGNKDRPVAVPPEDVVSPASVENHHEEKQSPTVDAHTTQSSDFLAVAQLPMGRSSSYREELDEIIPYGDPTMTTSADNTETEASDADKPSASSPKRKTHRRSRLPWANSSDTGSAEKVGNTFFSFPSTPMALGDDGKSLKRLQKKKRPKQENVQVNAVGIALSVGRPSSSGAHNTSAPSVSKSAESELAGRTLSPPPWVQQSNRSQSSLNASDFSRHSHISSNRSSIDNPPRSATPVGPPTTFAAIQQSQLAEMAAAAGGDNDDLPTEVKMPAVADEKQRTSSQSSVHSAASSSGKGSKIGAWLRKKRGFSVSSSTSAGGASAASD